MQVTARKVLTVGLFGWMAVIPVLAQEPAIVDGTIRFNDDPQFGNTQCSIINTLGEELFVRLCDRRIVLARSIFSGNGLSTEENNLDVLTPYKVETDFRVTDTRTGGAAGKVSFETDGNELRTLFWIADESFAAVDGISVVNGVVGYSRVDEVVTAPVLISILDNEGNVVGQRAVLPSDLGFDPTKPVGGRDSLFLPCGAERGIMDTDDRGEPVLGCDSLSGGTSTCGVLGSPLLVGLVLVTGMSLIRRSARQ
jgi:hypothetical protein